MAVDRHWHRSFRASFFPRKSTRCTARLYYFTGWKCAHVESCQLTANERSPLSGRRNCCRSLAISVAPLVEPAPCQRRNASEECVLRRLTQPSTRASFRDNRAAARFVSTAPSIVKRIPQRLGRSRGRPEFDNKLRYTIFLRSWRRLINRQGHSPLPPDCGLPAWLYKVRCPRVPSTAPTIRPPPQRRFQSTASPGPWFRHRHA
jgi:hypothetical protein